MVGCLSEEGLEDIAGKEGFVAFVYLDGEEPGVAIKDRKTGRPTVGFGHLLTEAEIAQKQWATGITRDAAKDLFRRDLSRFESDINERVTVRLNQNQYDALVSLVFNIGTGAFSRSTLLKKLNAGDFAGAAEQFGVWRVANGKVDKRLVKRRAEEASLFLRP